MQALTSPLCSFDHSPSPEFRRQLLEEESIQDQVTYFMHYPRKFGMKIQGLLQQQDGFQQVVAFIPEFIRQAKSNLEVARECLCELMMLLPSDRARSLLEDHPQVFAQLLPFFIFEQRETVLSLLSYQLKDWKDLLINVFQALERHGEGDDPRTVPAGAFVANLVTTFSSHRKRQWIRYCSNALPFEEWAFFILTLRGGDRAMALTVLMRKCPFELSEEMFLPIFENLACQTQYPYLVKGIVNKILHKFYQAGEFEKIVNEFELLSQEAQICLLDAMSSSKQHQVFSHYRQNQLLMAAWLDGLYHYQTDFLTRKRTITRICDALPEGKLSEFLFALNIRQSKVGAYFLICLAPQDFQEFIFTVPISVRTEILANSVLDSTSWQVLRSIQSNREQKQLIYEIMGLDMTNPVVPVDSDAPFTLSGCFQLLQEATLNPDLAADYAPFIIRIPPVLIGVFGLMQDQRKVLLDIATYLSEEQLRFLACSLPIGQFCVLMEKVESSLNNGQYIALLEGASMGKIAYYVKIKTQKLEDLYRQFIEKYQAFQADLDTIEEGEITTAQQYAKLQKQAHDLYAMARRPTFIDYHHLRRYLNTPVCVKAFSGPGFEGTLQVIGKLEQTMDNLSAKCSLFIGRQSIIVIQLSQLEKMLVNEEENQEIDLATVLYEGFWLLLREGTLPYLGISPHSPLGITHAGQLTCLGIQDNADLEILGISQSLLSKVDRCILDIEQLQGTKRMKKQEVESIEENGEHQTFQSVQTLWKACLDIRLSDDDLPSLCHQLIENLNLHQLEICQLKEKCLNFSQQLLTFQHLSEIERAHLNEISKQLENCFHTEVPKMACLLFEKGLMVLRNQHPLFCLQRYLIMNTNLKKTWEILRSKGCVSIRDLLIKKIVHSPADLLRLEEITQGLSIAI